MHMRRVQPAVDRVAALHRCLSSDFPDVLPLLTGNLFDFMPQEELWTDEGASRLATLARWAPSLFNR
jgi:hypothetical protein